VAHRLVRALDRYVFTEFMKIFVTTALGFPVLVIVIDLTDNIDKYLNRSIPYKDIALSYLYWLPDSMFMVLPAAVLFATVFSIGAVTRHQEITAAKASGISFYRFIAPIFAGALLATGLGLLLGELVPTFNQKRLALLQESRFREGSARFNFAYSAEGGRVYKVGTLNADNGAMDAVEIERKGKGPDYPTYILSAQSAEWIPPGGKPSPSAGQPPGNGIPKAKVPGGANTAATARRGMRPPTATRSAATDGPKGGAKSGPQRPGWVLKQGDLHILPDSNVDIVFSFDSLRDRHLRERPADLLATPKAPQEMGYRELGRYIKALERSGGDVNELRVERMLKITIPVTCLVILLFGAPLATSTQRGGAAYGVGVSLGTTVVFLMLIQLMKAVGGKGLIPPDLAAWMPSIAFAIVGAILLARVRT
jgi:lipopolysaccharide export LptBFGC system permease protein LptF